MTNHKNDCTNNKSQKFTFEDVNKNPKNSIPNPSKWKYPCDLTATTYDLTQYNTRNQRLNSYDPTAYDTRDQRLKK